MPVVFDEVVGTVTPPEPPNPSAPTPPAPQAQTMTYPAVQAYLHHCQQRLRRLAAD